VEMEQFDDLTRRLSGAGPSRRQALGALAGALLGGTLGGVATRLGLADVAEATPTKRKAKSKPKRHAQAERKAQSRLQAEGKKKGKKRRKKKSPPCDDLPTPLCGVCEEATCVAGGSPSGWPGRESSPPPGLAVTAGSSNAPCRGRCATDVWSAATNGSPGISKAS